MPLDGLFLRVVTRELQEKLVNSRVHKIRQPHPAEIIITLRQPGSNYQLLLSADPSSPRIHLTAAEDANPLVPYTFCLLLRKHLEPARLLGIEQAGWERLVVLRFEARGEDGQRTEKHLMLEIMGRHSNLLLVDPASQTILDGIRHVTSEQSRHRIVAPGKPYLFPPSQGKDDPSAATREQFFFHLRHVPAPMVLATALAGRYDGLSPDGAREIVYRTGLASDAKRADLPEAAADSIWENMSGLVEQVTIGPAQPWGATDPAGRPLSFWFSPLTHLQLPGAVFPSANALLDWYYTNRQQKAALEAARIQLQRVLRAALERSHRRLAHQDDALQEAARAAEYKLKGELLLTQLHQVPPSVKEVILENYYNPEMPVRVELDPALPAGSNAEKYFKRYHKAKKTFEKASAQHTAAMADYIYYESVLQAVEQAGNLADLAEIEEELQAQGVLETVTKRSKSAARTIPVGYLRLHAPDGTEILVGKNNKQNDTVTMGLARSEDTWLHTKNIPGAHVIIRSTGASVSDETMNLAAQLAAYYSKARDGSQVPVDYCLRRHVRKPKGARPGFVIYDHQKTAYITPDAAVVAQLIGQAGAPVSQG